MRARICEFTRENIQQNVFFGFIAAAASVAATIWSREYFPFK